MNYKNSWWLVLLFLGACSGGEDGRAMGTLERDRMVLSAPVAEQISAIMVTEGQQVHAGELLLQLDNRSASAVVAQRRASLEQARAKLLELQTGARNEQLAAAEAAMQAAKAQAEDAAKQYRRAQELYHAQMIGKAELDSATALKNQTQALTEQAQQQWLELKNGTRSEQLAQAQAQVDEAAAALAAAEKSLADLSLKAPRDGEVDILPWKSGDRVAAGVQLVTLLASDRAYARVYLPQTALAQVHRGAKVQVWLDGYSQPFSGTVSNIRSQPAFTPYFALNERDRARLMYLTDIDLPGAASLPVGIALEVRLP
ncbi:HlyD family secretion protein [Shewanella dokdonensis]|uniref:HlyD family efflux transporter periplasmic adaptor subunit n=1 Tax=Shewanella dokdonensis TaxID=712036 RepID=A0ABX8DFE9_9GAMM|nr:HlyD family efflux transporter periplasmic adaptor subunit [Shewanella dokdonensis]MCL1075047.1 HlyD family efflux transporter periplasmic adaptor subunit [Shewanella dokdonensis]QVK23464.1 HlyD family efflux transporter periplasmic adaptor subunit [Shewanella dokdonensis]